MANLMSIYALLPSVGLGAQLGRRAFHISTPALVRQKHLKRLNRLHKHWAKELFKDKEEWVDPVLGKPDVPFLARMRAIVGQPENEIDFLSSETTSKLLYGAESALMQRPLSSDNSSEDSETLERKSKNLYLESEARKREALLRIVSLRNSNQQQSQKQAVSLARKEFQRFEGDTGSPEVQAAVSTMRIHFLALHVKETKKDFQSKRRLEHMVQSRRNMLLYLKRTDPRRYMWTIEKLGLSDDAVSAEFHMSRKYLWKTQFYGDRTLPLKKTKKDTREARKLATKRDKAEKYLAQHNPEMLFK